MHLVCASDHQRGAWPQLQLERHSATARFQVWNRALVDRPVEGLRGADLEEVLAAVQPQEGVLVEATAPHMGRAHTAKH